MDLPIKRAIEAPLELHLSGPLTTSFELPLVHGVSLFFTVFTA
jgi:hypothetical protein